MKGQGLYHGRAAYGRHREGEAIEKMSSHSRRHERRRKKGGKALLFSLGRFS